MVKRRLVRGEKFAQAGSARLGRVLSGWCRAEVAENHDAWPGLSLRSPGRAAYRGFEDSAPPTPARPHTGASKTQPRPHDSRLSPGHPGIRCQSLRTPSGGPLMAASPTEDRASEEHRPPTPAATTA